jgi:hypothetical protein
MGLFHNKDKAVSAAPPQTYAPQAQTQPPQQGYQPQTAAPPKEDKAKTKGFVKWTSAFVKAAGS